MKVSNFLTATAWMATTVLALPVQNDVPPTNYVEQPPDLHLLKPHSYYVGGQHEIQSHKPPTYSLGDQHQIQPRQSASHGHEKDIEIFGHPSEVKPPSHGDHIAEEASHVHDIFGSEPEPVQRHPKAIHSRGEAPKSDQPSMEDVDTHNETHSPTRSFTKRLEYDPDAMVRDAWAKMFFGDLDLDTEDIKQATKQACFHSAFHADVEKTPTWCEQLLATDKFNRWEFDLSHKTYTTDGVVVEAKHDLTHLRLNLDNLKKIVADLCSEKEDDAMCQQYLKDQTGTFTVKFHGIEGSPDGVEREVVMEHDKDPVITSLTWQELIAKWQEEDKKRAEAEAANKKVIDDFIADEWNKHHISNGVVVDEKHWQCRKEALGI